MVKKAKVFSILFLLAIAATTITVVQAYAEPVEMLDVSIIFYNAVDESFLSHWNVQIKHRFQTFAAVSVYLPSNALYALENNPNVK